MVIVMNNEEYKYECFVTCSRCGKKVSNTVLSKIPEGLIIGAFIECAECVSKNNDNR